MIKRLIVKGLNEKMDLDLHFQPDLNLLTGKNGSSKTTILKLIWFLNAGRLASLYREILFHSAELVTSNFSLKTSISPKTDKISVSLNGGKAWYIDKPQLKEIEFRMSPRYREKFYEIEEVSIPTIFFPTFRRIEGGFSMDIRTPRYHANTLKESMVELSTKLSRYNHRFIASISTDDIVQLLTSEYARVTDTVNRMQKENSDLIINKIKNRTKNESATLEDIQTDIELMEENRKSHFRPFTVLSNLITEIFQHKGIQMENLSFGDVSDSVASEKLSAGEKQMLSFICYNIFTKESTIFIDEPELSLHPDWQRTLVPTLLNQGNNNQFFMATHSPFIYSKYADKEIVLSQDKGN